MWLTFLGSLVVLIVNLAVTPILVRRLKPDGYALFTLMWTLIGYLALLDLGTTGAVQKYIAQYRSHRLSPVGPLLRAVLLFHLCVSTAGGAVLFLSRQWLAKRLLEQGGALAGLVPHVFACAAIAGPAYFLLQLANSILYGMQRFTIFNILTTLQFVSVALCAAASLRLGWGLKEIAVIFVVAHYALAAASLWFARDVIAKKDDPPEEHAGFARFSARTWMSQIFSMISFQGDRIFIGSNLPLAQMGYYAVSASLAQKINMVGGAISTTAFPMLTELHGSDQKERLRRFYLKIMELSLFIILPLTILSFVLVPQFMTFWLGLDFGYASTWPFRLILMGNLTFLVTYLPYALARGMGHPQMFTVLQAAKALVLVCLWPWCIPRWGIMGAAAGLLASEWLTNPVFVWYIHHDMLGVGVWEFWDKSCYRPAVAGIFLAALAVAAHSQIHGWIGMIAFSIAGLAVYWGAGYWLLDAETKAMAAAYVSRKLGRA